MTLTLPDVGERSCALEVGPGLRLLTGGLARVRVGRHAVEANLVAPGTRTQEVRASWRSGHSGGLTEDRTGLDTPLASCSETVAGLSNIHEILACIADVIYMHALEIRNSLPVLSV